MKQKRHNKGANKNRFKRFLYPVLVLFIFKTLLIINEIADFNILSVIKQHPKEVEAQQTEETSNPETAPSPEDTQNPVEDFQWSYELVMDIKQREKAVKAKEEDLKLQEQRLMSLKQDIENKIEQLLEIQSNISRLVETQQTIEDERLFKLAKVFEETPPEQAGPLFSKLDDEIAAQLLLKMTGRKAGRIWGFVDPEKAVSISQELARIKPDYNISNITNNQ